MVFQYVTYVPLLLGSLTKFGAKVGRVSLKLHSFGANLAKIKHISMIMCHLTTRLSNPDLNLTIQAGSTQITLNRTNIWLFNKQNWFYIVDIVFCPPSICMPDLENSKNINFLPRDSENIQIEVRQPVWAMEHFKCHFRSN